MAKFGVFRNGQIIVNAYNLSDHCHEFVLNSGTTELPDNAMGDQTVFSAPGLHTWSVTARFYQDFAAGQVYEALENMRLNRTKASIVMKANASLATSQTNPAYSGTAFISSLRPIGGTHGDNLITEVTFSAGSDLTTLTA